MDKTYKMTKVVGESEAGIEQAAKAALKTSAEAVRGHTWASVADIRANLGEGGTVDRWQVTLEVAFEVEKQ